MSAELGFIGGAGTEEAILSLRAGIDDDGVELDPTLRSPSEVYQTPGDIFKLLLNNAHFGKDDSRERMIDDVAIATDLLRGANFTELMRFSQFIIAAKNYVGELMRIYQEIGGDVYGTMRDLRLKYEHTLAPAGYESDDLFGPSEEFLAGISDLGDDIDLEWLYARVSDFSYAVERVVFMLTGIES